MDVAVDRPVRPMADLSGITGKEILRRGYERQSDGEERFVVQFAVNLSATEEAAVRRRLTTTTDAEEQLQARAWAATQDMLAFEATAAPTNAQVVAFLKLLSRAVRALIRLQLKQLDAVD